jgi:hypothetical protein
MSNQENEARYADDTGSDGRVITTVRHEFAYAVEAHLPHPPHFIGRLSFADFVGEIHLAGPAAIQYFYAAMVRLPGEWNLSTVNT